MPPEVILGKPVTLKSDIWNLAMTILETANKEPFNANNPLKTMMDTVTGKLLHYINPSLWSKEMSHFLGECFQMDPASRSSALTLLQHNWLQTGTVDSVLNDISCIIGNSNIEYPLNASGKFSKKNSFQ